MMKILTIFNIFAGIASIMGFIFMLCINNNNKFKKISIIVFSLAGLTSIYILFYPAKWIESNVKSKFQYYNGEFDNPKQEALLIQRDEFSFSGNNFSVEFPIYYKKPPKVEIISVGEYNDTYVPQVKNITEHHFILYRSTTGGLPGEGSQRYIWIAKGEPLEQPKDN